MLGVQYLDGDDAAAERIRVARSHIDLTRPGVVEALGKLQQDGCKDPAEFEALARAHPIGFDGGFEPVGGDAVELALQRLRKVGGAKAAATIRRGSDVGHENPPRIPWGNLTLDYITGGGVPRGRITQLKGNDSYGKTFAALKLAAEVFRYGGCVGWVPVEDFDKGWARRCGVSVPFSTEELGVMSPEQQGAALAFNTIHPEGQNFVEFIHDVGNVVLQSVVDAVAENVFDLVVVDSIAVLQRETTLSRKITGQAVPGGEAYLIGDFCRRVGSAFNAVEKQRGQAVGTEYTCEGCGLVVQKKSEHGSCGGKKPKWGERSSVGQPVRTAIVLINQLRDQGIDAGYYIPPDAPGGRGLRHHKSLDVLFAAREPIATMHAGRPVSCGVRIKVEVVKSKVCPPGRKGVIEFYHEDVPGFCQAGAYNPFVDVVGCRWKEGSSSEERVEGLAEMSGIVQFKPPAYYTIGDQKFHGIESLRKFLLDPANGHVLQAVQAGISQWIRSGRL